MNSTARSVSAAAQLAAPRPASQVEQHNNALRSEIEGLGRDIEALQERLARVTRVEEPSKGEVGPPEEMLVTAAEEARSMGKIVVSLRSRIRSLTERVEA